MKKRALKVSIVFFSFFFLNIPLAHAASSISTFTVSDSIAFNGQLVSLSWSGAEVSGFNLMITCATGVKFKSQADGSQYACDSRVATSNQGSDTLSFFVTNVSGSNKTVTFRLYPKDSDGTENTSAMQSRTMTITPAPYPISSASVSTTTTSSGVPTVLTWSAPDLEGVNIILGCVNGITATSSVDNLYITCGQLAYATKLANSGSLTLNFKSTNTDRVTVPITVLPYIGDGQYDLSHSYQVYVDVIKSVDAPADITSFTASKTAVSSGDDFTISWMTRSMSGVNLKIDCVDGITASAGVSTTTKSSVKCGTTLYDSALSPNGTLTLSLSSAAFDARIVGISLLPQLPNGGFDAVNLKKIFVTVVPKGQSIVTANTPVTQNPSSSVSSSAQAKKMISMRKKLFKALTLGARGDDVSALQEFLRDNGYYPGGQVTGYYGKLTEAAVKKFQEGQGIAKFGQAGYGNVGPMTRQKLNSI